MTVNSTLWDAVQEHIDNNYNPSTQIEDDPIDWVKARNEAHEALDDKFGADAVDNAIDTYKN